LRSTAGTGLEVVIGLASLCVPSWDDSGTAGHVSSYGFRYCLTNCSPLQKLVMLAKVDTHRTCEYKSSPTLSVPQTIQHNCRMSAWRVQCVGTELHGSIILGQAEAQATRRHRNLVTLLGACVSFQLVHCRSAEDATVTRTDVACQSHGLCHSAAMMPSLSGAHHT